MLKRYEANREQFEKEVKAMLDNMPDTDYQRINNRAARLTSMFVKVMPNFLSMLSKLEVRGYEAVFVADSILEYIAQDMINSKGINDDSLFDESNVRLKPEVRESIFALAVETILENNDESCQ